MSAWNRQRVIVIDEFIGFPKEIARIIAEYCMELRLLPWIDKDKLDRECLYSNPKALEAGWLDLCGGDSYWIAGNPAAGEVIKADIDRYIWEPPIWENPSVFEFLIESGYPINNEWFSLNPHPKAVQIMLANFADMNMDHFNENPSAVQWLRENPRFIDNECICANPAAIDIIQRLPEINYDKLSSNSHPWAMEQLHLHQDRICWIEISSNPGIFEHRIDDALVSALTRE